MKFDEFAKTIFKLIDMEQVPVVETTNFKNELEIDSLQMVNLIIGIAEFFKIPFEKFIQNSNHIQTVGGLFELVKRELNQL